MIRNVFLIEIYIISLYNIVKNCTYFKKSVSVKYKDIPEYPVTVLFVIEFHNTNIINFNYMFFELTALNTVKYSK